MTTTANLRRCQLICKNGVLHARDIMTSIHRVYSCASGFKLREVMDEMLTRGFSHVPVLDTNNLVVGVFSEHTMFEVCYHAGVNFVADRSTVSDVMQFIQIGRPGSCLFPFVSEKYPVLKMCMSCINALKKQDGIGMFLVTKNGDNEEPLSGVCTLWDIVGAVECFMQLSCGNHLTGAL